MPKTTKSGSAKKSGLPSTLQKSPAKAQRMFAKVHDAAVKEYGGAMNKNEPVSAIRKAKRRASARSR